MNDLISRDDAIREIMKLSDCIDEDMIFLIFSRLRKIPPARQWIPVTDGLPEEAGWFLTSVSHKFTNELKTIVRWFSTAHGFEILGTAESVKAWMPLPEPYRNEAEE